LIVFRLWVCKVICYGLWVNLIPTCRAPPVDLGEAAADSGPSATALSAGAGAAAAAANLGMGPVWPTSPWA
jgi:hypothetical protein